MSITHGAPSPADQPYELARHGASSTYAVSDISHSVPGNQVHTMQTDTDKVSFVRPIPSTDSGPCRPFERRGNFFRHAIVPSSSPHHRQFLRQSARRIAHVHVSAPAPGLRARTVEWMRDMGCGLHLSINAIGPYLRRVCDIILASSALALALPICALAALAIKLSSKGPVLYWQERIGQGGKRFCMPKLRTMVQNAERMKTRLAETCNGAMDGARFKLKRDPRITAVGRILRRYSIDELPQIWSVLKGDMTIIGPRPPLHREVVLYDSRAARRLSVKPGLTCLWQINGRSDLSFDEQVDLDIFYIDRIRVWDEIKILLKTVPAVLSGRGAY